MEESEGGSGAGEGRPTNLLPSINTINAILLIYIHQIVWNTTKFVCKYFDIAQIPKQDARKRFCAKCSFGFITIKYQILPILFLKKISIIIIKVPTK